MTLRTGFASVLVLVLAIAAGCVSNSYRSEQAGVVTAGKIRVTLGSGWQRAPTAEVPEKRSVSKVYSRDGLEHDRLIVVASIAGGEAIFRDEAAAGLPRFQTGMTDTEIADLVAKSLERVLWDGAATVVASNARAHGFTGIPGFKFELEADVPGAADHRGMAGGLVDDDRLYVTIFLAVSPENYERHRQEAQGVIDSTVLTIKTIRMN